MAFHYNVEVLANGKLSLYERTHMPTGKTLTVEMPPGVGRHFPPLGKHEVTCDELRQWLRGTRNNLDELGICPPQQG